ncbi:hypothetical protein Tco_0960748, partial [Tanacetum coccineum]
HPSETIVFHNEDGNPARANIKQALGYLIDGDGDGKVDSSTSDINGNTKDGGKTVGGAIGACGGGIGLEKDWRPSLLGVIAKVEFFEGWKPLSPLQLAVEEVMSE